MFLPVMVFGLLSGAVADRVERRRLLWSTDVARTAVATLLAAAVLVGRADITRANGRLFTGQLISRQFIGKPWAACFSQCRTGCCAVWRC